MIDIWITKYALAKGIHKTQAESAKELLTKVNIPYATYLNRHEFELSEEMALVKAEEMRAAKIEFHQEQIKKLQNKKTFKVHSK